MITRRQKKCFFLFVFRVSWFYVVDAVVQQLVVVVVWFFGVLLLLRMSRTINVRCTMRSTDIGVFSFWPPGGEHANNAISKTRPFLSFCISLRLLLAPSGYWVILYILKGWGWWELNGKEQTVFAARPLHQHMQGGHWSCGVCTGPLAAPAATTRVFRPSSQFTALRKN